MYRVVLDEGIQTKTLDQPPLAKSYDFMALAARRDAIEAAIMYEVKGARAIFDPDLGDGNGGWRCPPGTRYAGRWTDRFGRNCGVGIVRRIGHAINRGQGLDVNPADSKVPKVNPRAARAEARAAKLERRAAELAKAPSARPPSVPDSVKPPKVDRRAERRERRARQLSELAKVEDGKANRLREAIGEAHTPKPVQAEDRASAARIEQHVSQPKPPAKPKRAVVVPAQAQRRKPKHRPRPAPQARPQALAPDRFRGGPDAWQRHKIDRANPDLSQLTPGELSQLHVNVFREHNRAFGNNRVDLGQVLDLIQKEKENRRARAGLPPVVPGILHTGGNKPKVGSLAMHDFTQVEQDAIVAAGAKVRGDHAIARVKDEYKTIVGVDAELGVVNRELRDNLLESDAIVIKLRSDLFLATNPEDVRGLQVRLMQLREEKAILQRNKVISGERLQQLEQRAAFDRQALLAANEQLSLKDRRDALNTMKSISDNLDAMNLQFDNLHDVAQDRNAREVALLETTKSIDAQELGIYGPKDHGELVAAAGLPRQQAKLDKLIKDVNEAGSDDKEAAIQALSAYRQQLASDRQMLGPLQEDPGALQANMNRRFYDEAIKQADGALRVDGSSLDTYKDVLSGESRPDVLGSIFSGDAAREITSATINNKKDAVEHIRNGGSLDDIPNHLWREAIEGNSSFDSVDQNSRFRQIPKKGGDIGDVRIFVARGADGMGTSFGYVFKAAEQEDHRTGDQQGAGEMVSQMLMKDHGFPVRLAGWDGRSPQKGTNYVVLPYAWDEVDTPITGARNYDTSIFNGMEAESIAPRLHGALHNFLLGVSDRHSGNGFTGVVNGKPVVIPIDQGWAASGSVGNDLHSYVTQDYFMDGGLFGAGAAALIGDMQEVEARRVVETYDETIRRAEASIAGGVEEWKRRIVGGANGNVHMDEVTRQVEKIFKSYVKRVESLKRERRSNLAKLMSGDLHGRLVP